MVIVSYGFSPHNVGAHQAKADVKDWHEVYGGQMDCGSHYWQNSYTQQDPSQAEEKQQSEPVDNSTAVSLKLIF